MKKVIPVAIICLLVFWISRIFSINQYPPACTVYNIGDTVDCGDLELHFAGSHLDDPDVFKERFGIEYDNDIGEYKVIWICIDVTSRSDADIEWDDVFSFLECGFESQVWGSVMSPEIDMQINRLNSESLAPGATQSIWFAAPVNKVCFKDSSWEKIDAYQYYYVLSLSPVKTEVRLEV